MQKFSGFLEEKKMCSLIFIFYTLLSILHGWNEVSKQNKNKIPEFKSSL